MTAIDIHRAAREGQTNLVRTALEADSDSLFALDTDSRNALQNAITTTPATVQAILDFLTPLETPDRKRMLENKDQVGGTALLSAASSGNLEIITALVGAGADVGAINDKGMTALHYAASKGHVAVGKFLIAKGADINIRDRANQLPLHRAATTGALPFVHLILNSLSPTTPNKPRLNMQDRAGNTPLHLAIESGFAEVAVALIEAGADRERNDLDGKRPEEIDGVLGQEAKKVRDYIVERCGPLDK